MDSPPSLPPSSQPAGTNPVESDKPSRVLVSYLDEFHIWPHVGPILQSKLPLKNVEWRPPASANTLATGPVSSSAASGTSGTSPHSSNTALSNLRTSDTNVRLLPTVDVELVRFTPDLLSSTKYHPLLQLRQVPFLHLYLINCDDVEVYRQVVRKQIKQWLDAVTAKRNQEWLIIHVTQDSNTSINQAKAAASGAKFPQFKGAGVWEKIRSDFNVGKKDRCAQIRLGDRLTEETSSVSSSGSTADLWKDLLDKLAEGICSSFGAVTYFLQDDMRKMETERKTPGFNFFNFFAVKESVALAFETFRLHEEALIQYQELEAIFYDCVEAAIQKDAEPWKANFGAKDPLDDSASVFSIDKKSYQEQIVQNSISLFDFRCYLFARQARLLLCLAEPIELLRRAKSLISGLTRGIVEHRESLIPFFLEGWVFSVCMDVIEQCERFQPEEASAPETIQYERLKADMAMSARRQLDKLGLAFGYILHSNEIYFSADRKPTSAPPKLGITNKLLLATLSSAASFDTLYIQLSQKAKDGFFVSGRMRTVRLIQCDIASIYFYRGRWMQAHEIFRNMLQMNLEVPSRDPNQPSIESWSIIDMDILMKWTMCLKQLGETKEYARGCATLLLSHERLSGEQVQHFVKELRSVAPTLSEDAKLELDFERLGTVQLLPQNPESDDFFIYDDGRVLQARLNMSLPVPLTVDLVQVLMYGKQGQDVVFRSSSDQDVIILEPGTNLVRLECLYDIPAGQYVAGNLSLHIGNIRFTMSFLKPSIPKQLFTIRESEQCLKVVVTAVSHATIDLVPMSTSSHLEASSGSAWAAPRFSPVSVPNRKVFLRIYTRDNEVKPGCEVVVRSHGKNAISLGDVKEYRMRVYKEFMRGSLSDLASPVPQEPDTATQVGITEDVSAKGKEVQEIVAAVKEDKLILGDKIDKYCIVEVELDVENRVWAQAVMNWDNKEEEAQENDQIYELNVSCDFRNEHDRRHIVNGYHVVNVASVLACEQHVVFQGKNMALHLTLKNARHDISVRILGFSLGEIQGIRATSASLPASNLILFPQQSVSFLYELAYDTEVVESLNGLVMPFTIRYRSLDQEIYSAIQKAVVEIMQTQEYQTMVSVDNIAQSQDSIASANSLSTLTAHRYVPFLTYFLYTYSIPNSKAKRIYNFYAMNGRVKLVPPPPWLSIFMMDHVPVDACIYDLVGHPNDWWMSLEAKLVRYLNRGPFAEEKPSKKRLRVIKSLAAIVRTFYTKYAMVHMPLGLSKLEAYAKSVRFNLSVPICDVLTIVELEPVHNAGKQHHITVGEPYLFRIRCKQIAYGSHTVESRLFLELDFNHQHWICAGLKRRMITLRPGQELVFADVHLLPMKTGLLLLPEMTVRHIPSVMLEPAGKMEISGVVAETTTKEKAAEAQTENTVPKLVAPAPRTRLLHESFFVNSGKQVMVFPRQQSNTFWIPNADALLTTAAIRRESRGDGVVVPPVRVSVPDLSSPMQSPGVRKLSSELMSPTLTQPISISYLRPNLPSNISFLQQRLSMDGGPAAATRRRADSKTIAKQKSTNRFTGLFSRVAKTVSGGGGGGTTSSSASSGGGKGDAYAPVTLEEEHMFSE